MKWDLYLTRQEWEEIKAAVRDRAPKDKNGKPCCERCGKSNGRLKRSKKGYMVPHWLHTAHKHHAPMKSKNADDYMALCDSCHMWYDRQPDASGWVPQYRQGYSVTTTGDLIEVMKGAGLELWQVGDVWNWRIANVGGSEATALLAAGAAVGRLVLACEREVSQC
jgi:hypothetical protein